MTAMKTLRRMSVFMPCLRASVIRSSSGSSCFLVRPPPTVAACRATWLSTSGLPAQAAPTSHHLPLLSAERRSASGTRRGS